MTRVHKARVILLAILFAICGCGRVIQLEGTPGASPAIDRKRGFEEEIAKSDIEIIVSQAADFKRARGQSVMENLLQSCDHFQAVYAANDEMMLGAIEIWRCSSPTVSRSATSDRLCDPLERGKFWECRSPC